MTAIRPTPIEIARPLPGDDLLPVAAVVMDRAFSLPAPPEQVWPWLLQLGKRRAGWYLPRPVETVMPATRRGLRRVVPELQRLAVGDVIPDWGGPSATFEAVVVDPPAALVYRSDRGRTRLTWALILRSERGGTRVQLRLRLDPVRRPWLASSLGGAVDAVTVLGLAAGLRERLDPADGPAHPGRDL